MVDFGGEVDDGGLEGVFGGEVEEELEVAALEVRESDGQHGERWDDGWMWREGGALESLLTAYIDCGGASIRTSHL